ncbi:pimeloyl-ACP methyl ester carboxylesterase [Nocardioides thalensis]|uniref:Pimeloyl-ACP methyl ester carboxylesterase n=1 Tax=Nocardioides thalensis TaxID=1914755 RepID=A0A853C6C9_9ACTN|nr:alpha/beta hydrolase [Nocardioides thalensis]NYJ03064.1 pimeloyl-ACP methyl ester carboxylesterase [Nocardioides thalensis]
MKTKRVEIAGGEVEYVDTGGDGPTVVLLHGALMDEQLWMPVVERLSPTFRCVVPVLPLGAHRIPRPGDADQSPRGVALLVGELIRALDLGEVTLVGNDTGGAIAQLLLAEDPDLVARVVLVSCDAFDNFPPGLPGRTMALACAVPGGLPMAMASLQIPPLRRLPMTFGWMARRPIAPEVFDGWLDAYAASRGVRRDVRRMMRQVDREQLVTAAERLSRFRGSALVVWAAEDRVMPLDHAHRLCATFPDARLELVEDSYTLVPLDQPDRLAGLIAAFARRVRT